MNATAAYSDVAAQRNFTGPNTPLWIWGNSTGPVLIDAPYNGTMSMGPFTDHNGSILVCTYLEWRLKEVPQVPVGTYIGTITITLGY